MSWTKTIPLGDGLERLRKVAEEPTLKHRPTKIVDGVAIPMLRRDKIRMAHSVFQPRTFAADLSEDEAHLLELVKALKVKPKGKQFLDPVLVVAIGQDFFCVDGHHRLLAYAQVDIDGDIPVEYFEGNIDQAITEATRRNSKNRLAMTFHDKLEAGWRLVLLGELSKREIVEVAGIAASTVANMRKIKKQLPEAWATSCMCSDGFDDDEEMTSTEMMNLTWKEAHALVNGEKREFTDEARAAQVREWARRLSKVFGAMAVRYPEVFAEALELYSSRMPKRLVEYWPEIAAEVIDDQEASTDTVRSRSIPAVESF